MDAFGKKTLLGNVGALAMRACLAFQGCEPRNSAAVSVKNRPLLFSSGVRTASSRSQFFEAVCLETPKARSAKALKSA